MSTKVIAVSAEAHARWKKQAEKDGMPLGKWVEMQVDQVEQLVVGLTASSGGGKVRVEVMRPLTSTTVSPDKCLNRLPMGSYCRQCGTTHKKAAS